MLPPGSVGQQEVGYTVFSHSRLRQAALLNAHPVGNKLFLEGPEENVGGPCRRSPFPSESRAVEEPSCDCRGNLGCGLASLWDCAPPNPVSEHQACLPRQTELLQPNQVLPNPGSRSLLGQAAAVAMRVQPRAQELWKHTRRGCNTRLASLAW